MIGMDLQSQGGNAQKAAFIGNRGRDEGSCWRVESSKNVQHEIRREGSE